MNDRRESGQDTERDGLCASCRFREAVVSAKGSVFILCGRSRTDPAFPRYPPLPVWACRGHAPVAGGRCYD
jgi:hypothetical protein